MMAKRSVPPRFSTMTACRRRAAFAGAALLILAAPALGQDRGLTDFDPTAPDNLTVSLKLLGILTILSVAPAILLLTTAFPRIVIVLGFVRRALSTQEVPPNQVIIGLSLILTFMVMAPTFSAIKDEALLPYLEHRISDGQAFELAERHMREFMWSQVDPADVDLMLLVSRPELAEGETRLEEIAQVDVPTTTLMPAFVLSELKRAFEMGFMIYLPFVVIDLVVASTLISMGMLVLPPVLISLPFKVLVFVLVDGWGMVVEQLAKSFS